MFSLDVENVKEFGEHSENLFMEVVGARAQVEALSVEIEKTKMVLEGLIELRIAAAEEWGKALLVVSEELQAGRSVLEAASREWHDLESHETEAVESCK